MKITKQQLKDIIKEELETALNEKWEASKMKAPAGWTGDVDAARKRAEEEHEFQTGMAQHDNKGITVAGDPAGQEKETDFSGVEIPQRYIAGTEKGKFVQPVQGASVTSPLDYERFHPIYKKIKKHKGFDIGADEGEDIVHGSPIPGEVVGGAYNKKFDPKTGKEKGAGQTVKVRTPRQMQQGDEETLDYDKLYGDVKAGETPFGTVDTQAMHLVPGSNVPIGTTVQQGETIGKAGSTGGVTGTHLHLDPDVGGSEQEQLVAAQDVYSAYGYTPPEARQRPAPEEPPAEEPLAVASAAAAQKRAEQYPGRGKGPGGGTQVDLDTMKGPEGQRLGPKGKPLDAPPPAVASYKVKKGDSLSKLARARGITIEDIMAANPNIKNPNKIKLGQKLKIPPPTGKRDDDEGIPKPGQNLAEAWGFNMDLSKLNE